MLRFVCLFPSILMAAPLKKAAVGFGYLMGGSASSSASTGPLASAVATEQYILSALLSDETLLHRAFGDFASQYDRPYMGPDGTCKEDAESECEKRLQTFKVNVVSAHRLNDKSENRAVFGITKFMDMDDIEFAESYKGLKLTDEDQEMMARMPRMKVGGGFMLPKKVDWREEGIITPVKDQQRCGSCWAHSVVEQMESIAIKNKIVGTDFRGSPQELVSCDTFDNGCNGGSPLFGFNYFEKRGLETEKDYPYTSGTGERGTCKLDPSKGKVETGEIYTFDDENDMTNFMQKTGPISIAVDALHWKTYKSGIFPASQCTGKVDHAVQAVGLDMEAPEPYWIVRNSWNTDWGEKGYINLPYGKQACSLTTMPSTADVKRPDMSNANEDEQLTIDV